MRAFAVFGLLALALAGCTRFASDKPLGPVVTQELHGARLIVIAPTRRWQALLDWKGDETHGWARITHPASGVRIELRWQGEEVWLRSSEDPDWRRIEEEELARYGLVLPPAEVAAFLIGDPPADARRVRTSWRLQRSGATIFVRWIAKRRAWRFEDRRHGRMAEVRLP